MNDNYVIVSDATADMPYSCVKELGIEIIPMSFVMDGKEYQYHPDERDITIKEFYTRLRAGADSVTSQINPEIYREYFGKILADGKDILYIAFSSGLSGTYNSARLMREELLEDYPERKIELVDSLCASIGEGLLVLLAGRMKQAGASFEEVCSWTHENCTKICHWFPVDDLNHLKKGGRLSGMAALVGTALQIKPVLSINPEGKLTVVAKARGTKKAMDYIKERLKGDGIDIQNQVVFIGHADAIETAETLKKQLLDEGLVREVIIADVGPIIGTHVGGGMFALTFLGENYNF